MEEKKTVEKTGLPIMLNGVELTEKDLHCLAQHLAEMVNRKWHHKKNTKDACQACRFCAQCLDEGNLVLNPWAAFEKLAMVSGVRLCRFSHCSGKNC